MSEISNQSTDMAHGEELDDFDVEGHGLREVALGLSAATMVVGGAGAAALAMDNPAPGTTSGAHAAVSGVQGDLQDRLSWASLTASGAVDQAGAAVTDVQQLADRTGATAITAVQPVVKDADAALATASTLAGDVVADPIGTSDRIVDDSLQTVRDVRSDAVSAAHGAVDTAGQTADTAVTTATQTANNATELAGSTADQAQNLVGSTAEQVLDLADARAEVQTTEGGTSASVGAAGTSITVETR